MPSLGLSPAPLPASPYEVRVEYGGEWVRGWLTYDLASPCPARERDVALLHGAVNPPNGPRLPAVQSLRDRLGPTGGRTEAAKRLVIGLLAAPDPHGELLPVVHRFGPVPAVVVGEGRYGPSARPVRVVLFPNALDPGAVNQGHPENKVALLECLEVSPLALVFRRYFEDVAADLLDIAQHLSLQHCFRRAKKAEETLAQSVQTKLAAALERDSRPEVAEAQESLVERSRAVLQNARFARNVALYLLNELYASLGVAPRSEHYRREMEETVPTDDPGPAIEALRDGLANYDEDRAWHHPTSSGEPWADDFVSFMAHLSRVRHVTQRAGLRPEVARVFVSYQYRARRGPEIAAGILRRQDTTVRTLEFAGYRQRTIVDEVRAMVTMSDALVAVITKDRHADDGSELSLSWVLKEAEQALRTGRRVQWVVEDGVKDEEVVEAIRGLAAPGGAGGLLTGDPRSALEDRLRKLQQSYDDSVRARVPANRLDLGGAVSRVLDELDADLPLQRHIELVKGYLSQFSDPSRAVFVYLNQIGVAAAPLTRTKDQCARLLHGEDPSRFPTVEAARKAFENAWAEVRREKGRVLWIDRFAWRPINQPKKRGRYSGALPELFRHLHPGTLGAPTPDPEQRAQRNEKLKGIMRGLLRLL